MRASRGTRPAGPARELQAVHKGAQAAMIAVDRALGATVTQLAKKYTLSPDVIRARLSLAEELDVFRGWRSVAAEALIPKTLAVYETALDNGSLEAARDILFGLGILNKNATLTVQPGEETLESWRATRLAARSGGAIDVTVERTGNAAHEDDLQSPSA